MTQELRDRRDIFVRVLSKLELNDLYALAHCFPGCSTATWEYQSDAEKREDMARNFSRSVEEMIELQNQLRGLVGALRTLGGVCK